MSKDFVLKRPNTRLSINVPTKGTTEIDAADLLWLVNDICQLVSVTPEAKVKWQGITFGKAKSID